MTIITCGFDGLVTESAYARQQSAEGAVSNSEGVANGGGNVTVSTGRTLSVSAVEAVLGGAYYSNDTAGTVTLDANSSGANRIDYIILDADWTTNSVTLTKKNGSTAAPALIRTPGTRWQMPLARVTVPNGATTLTADNIEVCKPLPRFSRQAEAAVPASSTNGSNTVDQTLAIISLTDPGWPYLLHVDASVRFLQVDAGGFGRIRAFDLLSGASRGSAVSAWLTRRATCDLSATTATLTGPTRMALQFRGVNFGLTTDNLSVDDDASNRFQILQIPSI